MVIAIIGILAAVLIPTFSGAIESARVAGGTSNAKNLSTLLMTEAVYDNKAWLPTDRVWEIAEENNISLESEVDTYSYWYDASTNRVTYAKTADMLSGAVNLNTAQAAESFAAEPETLVEGKPQYRYIERSATPIRQALDVIRGVSGNATAASVDSALDAAIAGLSEQSLKDHFAKFKTSNCVYFTDNGVIKGSGTSFEYAVVPFNTTVLPTLTASLNINVTNKIVLPASVTIISENAFSGVTATVTATGSVVLEGETGLIGDSSFSQTSPAANVINIDGSDGNKVEDYLDIDYAKGSWVYYKNGKLVDSLTSEQKKAYDSSVDCDYAYVMPQVTVKSHNNFFDRVEKLTLRSKLVSGGIEFVMVAVDTSYNVYKLENVGIVTEVGVSYPDYTKRINAEGEQENITAENFNQENTRKLQLLVSEEVRDFSNLADCDVTLSYQTGVATYATMKSPYDFWLMNAVYRKDQTISWEETVCTTEACKFSALSNGISVTFDDTAHTGAVGEKEFQLTEMQATRIEVKSGDTLIYVRNYAGSDTAAA